MEPAKLTKLVRGELDWIVMKTLEKDRNRRYETASGFAADVQRYLADEPVRAYPASALYRFRKFARRNKMLLTAATLVAVTVLVAGSTVTWKWTCGTSSDPEGATRHCAPHTVTFDLGSFTSPTQTAGAYERKFTEAGTYAYYCVVHPTFMVGKVIVVR